MVGAPLRDGEWLALAEGAMVNGAFAALAAHVERISRATLGPTTSKRAPERQAHHLARQIAKLGFTCSITPHARRGFCLAAR